MIKCSVNEGGGRIACGGYMKKRTRAPAPRPISEARAGSAPGGTVLIADDHEILRFGLTRFLRASLGVRDVLEATNFEEALEKLERRDIDLVVVDLGMPGLSRPSDLAAIRRKRPDVRLLVLTASEAREDVLSALRAGAHGYVTKCEPGEDFLRALRQVMVGNIYVSPILAAEPASGGDRNGPFVAARSGRARLTDRQKQVLRLLARGRTNKDIARQLGLSESTAKFHVASLLRALGADNRAEAAALAQTLLD
jgi:DNA-binding NarL/FixJ family response regulator